MYNLKKSSNVFNQTEPQLDLYVLQDDHKFPFSLKVIIFKSQIFYPESDISS